MATRDEYEEAVVSRAKVLSVLKAAGIDFEFIKDDEKLILKHNPINPHEIILPDPVQKRMVVALARRLNIELRKFWN